MHRLSHIPQKIPVREPALLLTLYLLIRGFNNLPNVPCTLTLLEPASEHGIAVSGAVGSSLRPYRFSGAVEAAFQGWRYANLSPDNYHIRDNKQHLPKVLSVELSIRDRTQSFQCSLFICIPAFQQVWGRSPLVQMGMVHKYHRVPGKKPSAEGQGLCNRLTVTLRGPCGTEQGPELPGRQAAWLGGL